MPPVNKTTGITGVKIGYYKGRKRHYIVDMRRKKMKVKRAFDYSEEGKKMAANFYKKKLIEIGAY